MGDMFAVVLISLMVSRLSSGIFLHEPSFIPIHPLEYSNHSDFGFAMGFQASKRNLVVGAPTVDLKGKVYSCDMNNASYLRDISCHENYIDAALFGSSSKHVSNQHMYTGATIAATSNYFLTCAPLWSTSICGNKYEDAFGMCFTIDQLNKTTVYSSTYSQYCRNYSKPRRTRNFAKIPQTFNGGTGWSTLVDENNSILLIIKSSLRGDIVYTSLDTPNANSRSMVYYNEINFIVGKFYNLGFGITAGKFFSNQTTYAFSMMTSNMGGVIEFIKYNPTTKYLSVMNKNIENKNTIHNKAVGTMFGSVLTAADLNLDGFDELLVGAPAQTGDDMVECGALYIYLGGDVTTIEKNRFRIMGAKELSRFGTALAVKELDGDNIPELVVSAPYEDKGFGAVYIISGYEVYRKLKLSQYVISLSELKHTQRIQKETFRTLGFSLQFISDVDGNGCSELVAGSPGSGSAVLLKSIQAINVTLTATLIGEQIVKEQDEYFTVEVCANVEYPKPPNNIYANLTLKNNIIGDAAFIPNYIFNFDISCLNCSKFKSFCKNSTVELKDREPRFYSFISELKLHTEQFNSSVLNSAWVVTSPHSQLYKRIEVSRHCSGDDCLPRLSLELLWSGSKKQNYVLGSSASEAVTIRVRNDGKSSYEACVFVSVTGAPLLEIECEQVDTKYRCDVLKPLRRGAEQSIDLVFKMTGLTNLDTKLTVETSLHEKCYTSAPVNQNITIPYVIDTNHNVYINGMSHSRNITNKEIQDDNDEIYDDQEYLITNNGSITWQKVVANIYMKKQPFINSFRVSADKVECIEAHANDTFKITCYLDLLLNSTQKIISTTGILKSVIKNDSIQFNSVKLNTMSQLELHLLPTNESKMINVTSILTLEQDLKVGNNKWLIALIAVILGIVILIVIIIVLYKYGFFKRKQKQRLLVLRESIKHRNSRRNTHISSVADEQGIEGMESGDDCAFEDDLIPHHNTTHDDIIIEEEAEEVK